MKLDSAEACVNRALEAFDHGSHCAQSALLGFSPCLGLEIEEARRMAASFGGGIGGLHETCGALCGALIADGIIEGDFAPGDTEGKEAHYERVQRIAERFREDNGSIFCRDIRREDPEERHRYCSACVKSAVRSVLKELGQI